MATVNQPDEVYNFLYESASRDSLEIFCTLFDYPVPYMSELPYLLSVLSQSKEYSSIMDRATSFFQLEERCVRSNTSTEDFLASEASRLAAVIRESTAFGKLAASAEIRSAEARDLPPLLFESEEHWLLGIKLLDPLFSCLALFDSEAKLCCSWKEFASQHKVHNALLFSEHFKRMVYAELDLDVSEEALHDFVQGALVDYLTQLGIEMTRHEDEIVVCAGVGALSKTILGGMSKVMDALDKDVALQGGFLKFGVDFEIITFRLVPLPDTSDYFLRVRSWPTIQRAKREFKVASLADAYVGLIGVPRSKYFYMFKRHVLMKSLESKDLYFEHEGGLAKWDMRGSEAIETFKPLPPRKAATYSSKSALIRRLSRGSLFLDRDEPTEIDFDMIDGRWRLGQKLGKGSFGIVFEACDVSTNEKFAVKLEQVRRGKRSKLQAEFEMMRELGGGPGIPEVFWFGVERGWNVMVMEQLDQCLKDLFRVCDKKLSLKSVVMLADQIIETLEYIHSKGYIHRDMKPQNLMMGKGDKASRVFLIDFGLSKRYVENGAHIPFRDDKKGITGTAEYVSLHTHRLIEQSRRDDLESLGYVLLKLLRGGLPWGDVRRRAPTKKLRNKQIYMMKTDREVLCRSCPVEFELYLLYTIGLRFDEDPDYTHLRKLFLYLLERKGEQFDYVYDWVRPLPAARRVWGSGKRVPSAAPAAKKKSGFGGSLAKLSRRGLGDKKKAK